MLGLVEAVAVVWWGDGAGATVAATTAATTAAAVIVATGVIRGRTTSTAHSAWTGTVARSTTIPTASVTRSSASSTERTRAATASTVAAGTELVPRVGITHPPWRRDDVTVLIALWWSTPVAAAGHGWWGTVAVFRAAREGSWH